MLDSHVGCIVQLSVPVHTILIRSQYDAKWLISLPYALLFHRTPFDVPMAARQSHAQASNMTRQGCEAQPHWQSELIAHRNLHTVIAIQTTTFKEAVVSGTTNILHARSDSLSSNLVELRAFKSCFKPWA